MRYEVTACDGCGNMRAETERISIYLGRQNDGAGGMETITEVLDLCAHCLAYVVNSLLAADVHDGKATTAAKVLEYAKGKPKTREYLEARRALGLT